MTRYLRGPLFNTWLFLASATLLSWWLGSSHEHATTMTTLFILLIAIVKCRFVIRTFMEVRHAPRWLKLTSDAWLVLNFGMVSALYWVA